MEPVVNGLEETYIEEVDFRAIDANTVDGQKAFRAYGLPGHPSYIILNPSGDVLWKGFGEQPLSDLADQIEEVVKIE